MTGWIISGSACCMSWPMSAAHGRRAAAQCRPNATRCRAARVPAHAPSKGNRGSRRWTERHLRAKAAHRTQQRLCQLPLHFLLAHLPCDLRGERAAHLEGPVNEFIVGSIAEIAVVDGGAFEP